MADDMGYSDIGCYGGEIQTPNLDNLAKGGLRFTQFYNTARCCPTRASLMTGLYAHQTGMGWMTAANLGYDGYRGDLNNKCVTIAEVLKRAGYRTYMAGKWHLTYDKYWDGPKHSWPRQRGFDRFYGTISGSGSYFNPKALTRDNTRIKAPAEGYYYTDAISDNAARFITEHNQTRGDEPYFLYVAYTAPHWPLHAKREDIAKYEGKYMKGWDVLRAERHKRMIKMGIVDDAWPLSPQERILKPWSQVAQARKEEMDLRMAIYAAQIDSMDQGIGRIVSAVKKTGKFDNTLILFLSDNGGCHEDIGGEEGVLGEDSSFASYGRSWANASNTPFRLYKSWVHEGGISTPLIVHWPVRINSGGKLRHQPGHLIDIMATCVDVAGAKYPSRYNGNKITPMEGKSLVPAFDNKPIKREAIYWEHEANRAVRVGNWKLVARGINGPWELYDLDADRTELNNLAQRYPERAKKLVAMWQRYAERTNVLPLDGRNWDERVEE
jgi:arylsulfatase